MANVVETVERDGVKVLVYDNGMERNADNGRMMRPPTSALITPETANVLQRRRQEKKREAIIAAANAAVERGDYRETYGDLAFTAAIAEAQYIKATTPDDPKSTDAARFLMQESGLSETNRSAVDIPAAAVAAGIASGLVGVLERVMRDVLAQQQTAGADVIEGKVNNGQLED